MRRFIFLVVLPAIGCRSTLDDGLYDAWRDDAVTLIAPGGKVIVSPLLQGRVMTTRVGAADSTGFICYREIQEGEKHEGFNNFGGQDRFWLGPEGGRHSLYFAPGIVQSRENWKVPENLDRGPFPVIATLVDRVRMERPLEFASTSGTNFQAKVEREVGLIPQADMKRALKVALETGTSYVGSYSENRLTNTGPEVWVKEAGIPNIWILGQFVPGRRAVIIAPVKDSSDPGYRDEDYFGKVPPSRLKVLPASAGKAVLLLADGWAEGKFGVSWKSVVLSPDASRRMGVAGSFDFDRNLLIVVRFDVPESPADYASSFWKGTHGDWEGDLFQCYNSDRSKTPDERYAFYELESVSPNPALAPGQTVAHRQETHCFQGEYPRLKELASKILGIDLDEVRKSFDF
jgi:hypothetical protein